MDVPDSTDQKVIDRVYQMVMWGEPDSYVRDYLSKQKVSDAEATELLETTKKERLGIIRQKYRLRIIWGVVLLIVGGCILFFSLSSHPRFHREVSWGVIFSAVGFYFLVDGVIKYLLAKKNTGSIAGRF